MKRRTLFVGIAGTIVAATSLFVYGGGLDEYEVSDAVHQYGGMGRRCMRMRRKIGCFRM